MLKKSDQLKNALLEQLRKTPIIQIACEKLSISRMSFYRWKAEDKEFAKKVDEAILEGQFLVNDLAESQLISAVKDRDMRAIMAWLRHHHPTYANKLKIEGAIAVTEELSPEQQKLVRRALELANLDEHHGEQ